VLFPLSYALLNGPQADAGGHWEVRTIEEIARKHISPTNIYAMLESTIALWNTCRTCYNQWQKQDGQKRSKQEEAIYVLDVQYVFLLFFPIFIKALLFKSFFYFSNAF